VGRPRAKGGRKGSEVEEKVRGREVYFRKVIPISLGGKYKFVLLNDIREMAQKI